jgi:hypothetical protein
VHIHEPKSQERLREVQLKKAARFFKVPVASAGCLGLVLAALLLNRSARPIAVKPDSRFSSKPASIQEEHQPGTPASEKKLAVTRALERMPLYFIENRGQLDSRVAYYGIRR